MAGGGYIGDKPQAQVRRLGHPKPAFVNLQT
jgi:hypothetical protein